MTNYEKIITMSKKKMAKCLCDFLRCYECPGYKLCNTKTKEDYSGLVKWLESEVEE